MEKIIILPLKHIDCTNEIFVRMEAWVKFAALGIEPRPSRVSGGERNHSVDFGNSANTDKYYYKKACTIIVRNTLLFHYYKINRHATTIVDLACTSSTVCFYSEHFSCGPRDWSPPTEDHQTLKSQSRPGESDQTSSSRNWLTRPTRFAAVAHNILIPTKNVFHSSFAP